MSNAMYKLILIEEIKRKAIDSDIKTFYSSLSEDELSLQLLCVDATLSRGSLPLAESFLLSQNMDADYIRNKINKLSDYDFYLTTEKIYNHLLASLQEKKLEMKDALRELNNMAVSGELDAIIA